MATAGHVPAASTLGDFRSEIGEFSGISQLFCVIIGLVYVLTVVFRNIVFVTANSL